jgi:hypothetical protein
LVQGRLDTDNLPHRPLTRICVGSFRELHPEPVAEMLFQGGVVDGMRRG